MTKEQIEALRDVNKQILKCHYCDFHEALRALPENFNFKPSAPIYDDSCYDHDFKIISIGINPGWNDGNENPRWQAVYKHDPDDYEGYVEKMLTQIAQDKASGGGRDPYARGIAKGVNLLIDALKNAGISKEDIAREMKIPPQTSLDFENVYKYVFWTNLSFCNSEKPGMRNFGLKNINIPCNTYTEEIPNCLRKGFLKDIVRIISPKLLIFFGSTFYYKVLLQKILGVEYKNIHSNGPIEVVAYKRAGKPVPANFYCAKITNVPNRNDDLYAIFLYHPNARIKNGGKKEGMDKICEQLKVYGFL